MITLLGLVYTEATSFFTKPINVIPYSIDISTAIELGAPTAIKIGIPHLIAL